jgi:hypothetical protein
VKTLLNKDYNKGFNDGTKHGVNKARKAVGEEFIMRLQKLRNEKGIGPKTWSKIMESLDIKKEL